jgi:nucleoside-diphosphate-sugar epimerase
MSTQTELRGKRIVMTGAGGQVGLPIIHSLAPQNEVWAVGRFSNAADRPRFEALGAHCVKADLGTDSLDELPADPDYVLHFAVSKTGTNALGDTPAGGDPGDFDADLVANAEGVGRLMARCRGTRAVLHCSTTGVYQHAGHAPLKETDPLGDNHRAILPTYSICKIAAEAVVRFAARAFDLPATIARLNVPYGDNGGWPGAHLEAILADRPVIASDERPNVYNPIHSDDIIAQLPRLLEIASVPATIINWAGAERVSIEEWCAYLGALVGRQPSFEYTPHTIGSVVVDTTKIERMLGLPKTPWRDGFRRMVASLHPELSLSD